MGDGGTDCRDEDRGRATSQEATAATGVGENEELN